MSSLKYFILILAALLPRNYGYKPVVFMHGIFSAGSEADSMFNWIKENHVGTKTYAIDLYDHLRSTVNMVRQQADVNAAVGKIMKEHPDGINLICYSQGGLLCRGVLQETQHNVDTFIGLSSPLAGQFGMTTFDIFFPNQTRDTVYKIAYTDAGQKDLSVCGYWNDPRQQTLYRKYSKYLAVLNNDTYNPQGEEWRDNFLRLKKLVLIGGPDDGVITPWQSAHFAYYNENIDVTDMTKQSFYAYDTFGLQTLAQNNRVYVYTQGGVFHKKWCTTRSVFDKYILPHLT